MWPWVYLHGKIEGRNKVLQKKSENRSAVVSCLIRMGSHHELCCSYSRFSEGNMI